MAQSLHLSFIQQPHKGKAMITRATIKYCKVCHNRYNPAQSTICRYCAHVNGNDKWMEVAAPGEKPGWMQRPAATKKSSMLWTLVKYYFVGSAIIHAIAYIIGRVV